MTIKEFVENYREAFGERAPLPIAVAYSDTPAAEVKSVPRCMIGAISYLNFVRVDKLGSWEEAQALVFFAVPDILSGLSTWAFYDNNSADAVTAQFASGCASIITFAINENRFNGRRCFLGMLDPSARPLVPENELTFSVPMCSFKEMLGTMKDSALYQKAFSVLKRRINGEL